MSLLTLENVGLSFGARAIVENLGLRIGDRDRIGLIGPNGSGKTTLLRVLAGEQAVDKGKVQVSRNVRIGYLPQDIAVEGGRGLLAFVLASVPGRAALDTALDETEAALAEAEARGDDDELMELAARIADIHGRIDHFEQFFAEHQAHRILAGLGFELRDRDRDLGEFSGGWKMRAVLASLLFQQPDLLLMDEPTNHLDMPSVAWLSEFLQRYPRAFLLISHDREFLNEQIDRVVSFEPEGVRFYAGNYDQYLRQRAEEERVLENKAKNLERERERMEKFVERFKAKATKARQASSRQKQLDRMEEVETLELRKTMSIKFPPVPRTVSEVVRVEGLTKAYGDHVVLDEVNLRVQRGDRIGIIGANGAGKTTLLKIVAGELAANGGELKIGNDVKVGYYAQHHAEMLHPDSTVLDEVSRATKALPARVRSVLGAFLFSGDDVDKPIGVLSGGERARVALARLLVEPGTLLLMDEPTNHLDLASSEALAESLADTYGGTLVFVSHNRAFVRRLATTIWNVEDGHVEEYPGTLDEYMDSCRRRLEAADRVASRDGDASSARGPNAAAAPAEPAEPAESEAPAKRTREEEKARKRREAELRKQRGKVVRPLEKKVSELEDRIGKLETAQKERGALLADPAVYADAKRRDTLLAEFQAAQAKLEELTGRWEAAVEALEAAEAEL